MAKIKKDPSKIPGHSTLRVSDLKRQDEKKIMNEATGEIFVEEKPTEVLRESRETIEEKENLSKEEIRELRKEIENMDVDDNLKQQVKTQAQNAKSLQDAEKIKHLLEITKEKGVVFAVKVAKNLDNPYVLDTLHDILIEKGYYKKFIK